MSEPDSQPNTDRSFSLMLASFAGQVGCATFVIIVALLLAGLWIDDQLGAAPWFTLILLIGSVPVTMIVVYRLAKTAGARVAEDMPKIQKTSQEDIEIGTDSS